MEQRKRVDMILLWVAMSLHSCTVCTLFSQGGFSLYVNLQGGITVAQCGLWETFVPVRLLI